VRVLCDLEREGVAEVGVARLGVRVGEEERVADRLQDSDRVVVSDRWPLPVSVGL